MRGRRGKGGWRMRRYGERGVEWWGKSNIY